MKLNIRRIMDVPSGTMPFSFALDVSDLDFPQIVYKRGPFGVNGSVKNVAGAIELHGEMEIDMTCICDRCLKQYEVKRSLPVRAYLADTLQDEENPDIFLLEGDEVDLDEVFNTAFVLNMDSKFVCSEECKGLCPICGDDLNDGPCGCGKEIDSRLAVLQQLLDEDDKDPQE